MRIFHSLAELPPARDSASFAIGFFDGVHLGHQEVIRHCIAQARSSSGRSIVVTFDRHPQAILNPRHAPPLIYPLSKRLRLFASLGADDALVIPFDVSFSRQTGDQFIQSIAHRCSPIASITVGRAFAFGCQRSGNLALLQQLGSRFGFAAHGILPVHAHGHAVSSTRIRSMIRLADWNGAAQLLGRPYALCGPVIRGRQLGRQLGFPTANLDVSGLLLPPLGVYAAWAHFGARSAPAVFNLGFRPTIQNPAPSLHAEAHLLDIDEDLYGRDLEIQFVQRLRDERRFSSTDGLREQIARDIAAARALLCGSP